MIHDKTKAGPKALGGHCRGERVLVAGDSVRDSSDAEALGTSTSHC